MAIDADTTVKVSFGGIFAACVAFGGWMINNLRGDYKDFKKDTYRRFENLDDEMAAHVLMDNQVFATKMEVGSLKDHMDSRFDKLQDLIIARIK